MVSNDIFPHLTFFIVGGEWNEKFTTRGVGSYSNRLFCSLESSLSLHSVLPFAKDVYSISVVSRISHQNNIVDWYLDRHGLAFAETGIIYKSEDLDRFRHDYYITMLSNLSQ